jgi:VanZ family protein
LRYWLPPVIWAAIILTLSGDGGSANHTGGLLRVVLPRLPEETLDLANLVIRKCGHVLGYGFLGFLNLRAIRGPRSGWRLAWSVMAVLLTACVASIDEWHQSMTSTRTGHFSDVMLDTVAAIGAQVFARRRT